MDCCLEQYAIQSQDIAALTGREGARFPAVSLGSTAVQDSDVVTFNYYAGMGQIMTHVFANGYRKPALIVGSRK
jgi:DNA-binding LacI/PurR family transcriptional regulator